MSLFELHDIKRDRVPYVSDLFWHRPVWSPENMNTIPLNLPRGSMSVFGAAILAETGNHFWSTMKKINYYYEWPRKPEGWSIFLRETMKTPFFWSNLWKKTSFGVVQASMDYGMRFASYKYWFGGTWSPIAFADFNSFKFMAFSFFSSFFICWTGIPFEVARKAYFADQTWPAELRKGYRSAFHALLKIPFVEGPYFLFRGGLPVYVGNALFTGWAFWSYQWLKNKLFFLWIYNDFSYEWIKFINLNIAFAVGSLFGYPCYQVKNILDLWPKERGGHCTFEGSSWNALKWLWMNYDSYNTNMYDGYWKWFREKGIIFYLGIWCADNFGMFSNHMTDFNSVENINGFDEID